MPFWFMIISFWGLCTATAFQFRLTMEETPFLVVSGMITAFYIFALCHLLILGSLLIWGMGLPLAIIAILRIFKLPQKNREAFFSPGIVIFFIAIILLWFKVHHAYFSAWDEFTEWGFATKKLFLFHQLSPEITPYKYPPGTMLFHYWFYVVMNFSEGTAYWAQDILMLSPLVLLFKNIRWRQILFIVSTALFIYFFLFVLSHWTKNPVSGGQGVFALLQVDTLLGVFFGMAGALYFLEDNPKVGCLKLIPILIALSLIKAVGFLFALLVMGMVLMDYIKRYTREWRAYLLPISIVFILFLVELSWYAVVHTTALVIIQKAVPLMSASAWTHLITKQYISALFTLQVGEWAFLFRPGYLPLTTFFWTLLFLFFSFVMLSVAKIHRFRLKVMTTMMLIGFLLYLTLLYVEYWRWMPVEYSIYLASFARYMGTYLLAWGVMIYALMNRLIIEKQPPIRLYFISVLFPALLILSAPPISFQFLLKPVQPILVVRTQLREVAKGILKVAPYNHKVYIILQKMPPFLFHVLSYELYPMVTNGTNGNLTTHKPKENFIQYKISPQEWMQELSQYNDLLLLYTDTAFWRDYGAALRAHMSQPALSRSVILWHIKQLKNGNFHLVPSGKPINIEVHVR